MAKNNDKPNLDDLKAKTPKSLEVVENQKVSRMRKNTADETTDETPNPKTKDEEILATDVRKDLGDYKQLPLDEIPRNVFYPQNWLFFYRCPLADEIAVFSTTPEEDKVKIMQAVTGLIRKCFIIIDGDTEKEITTNSLHTISKMYMFLLLRDFYMNQDPIKFNVYSPALDGLVEVVFNHHSLKYKELNQNLINIYNSERRGFEFPYDNEEGHIFVPITTIGMETKMLNYMVNNYKKLQKDETTKKDFSNFDKQFIAFIPLLFETGNESVESLKFKFKRIVNDDLLMKQYLQIMNIMDLGESSNIDYTVEVDGVEVIEDAEMKFPGGYKKLFTSNSFMEQYT